MHRNKRSSSFYRKFSTTNQALARQDMGNELQHGIVDSEVPSVPKTNRQRVTCANRCSLHVANAQVAWWILAVEKAVNEALSFVEEHYMKTSKVQVPLYFWL